MTLETKKGSLFSRLEAEGYEEVVFCFDPNSGLKSIIALHNLQLGPGLGGCRFYHYPSEESALDDALNLAQAMTYKAALAGLDLGGGKSVILGDPQKDKTKSRLRAFGSFVERLSGNYITTVDSGTSPEDMDVVLETTRHVVGATPTKGGSGDPSPMTAIGVVEGIRACAKFVFGSTDLTGKRIALQGMGHVGLPLAQQLAELGAVLIVTDTNKNHLQIMSQKLKAEIVEPNEIYNVKCDIFAPCAMGGVLNDETVSKLRCQIVAGSANNQLRSENVAETLRAQGIVYAPDFAINAGGLIQVAHELHGFDRAKAEGKTRKIFDTITNILTAAEREKINTSKVALRLAKERLEKSPSKLR